MTHQKVDNQTRLELESLVKWASDEGYTGNDKSQIHIEFNDGMWTVWMNSIETSSSWHGCGRGSTLGHALASVVDHTGDDCPCSRHITQQNAATR